MGLLSRLFSGGVSEIAGGVKSIIGSLKLDPAKKAETELAVEQLVYNKFAKLEDTVQTQIQAKEKIIVAELQQKDNYTKRARPTVVYVGLGAIIFNYCIIPTIQLILRGVEVDPFALPAEFWMAWGGIVGTWSIGRTVERRNGNGKITGMITGNKPVRSVLDD